MIIQKNNCFILTGAPGVGKTTLIKELQTQEVLCVCEPAREILAEQRKINGVGIPEINPMKFTELLLDYSIKTFKESSEKSVTIFDRGVADTVAYAELFKIDFKLFEKAAETYRFNKIVFVLSPWSEIYSTDDERKMTYNATVKFHELFLKVYRRLGYELIIVPQEPTQKRADFVLGKISEVMKDF